MKEINNDPKRFSEQLNNFSQDGDLNLLEIWNSVFRRKKFVGVLTALFFLPLSSNHTTMIMTLDPLY